MTTTQLLRDLRQAREDHGLTQAAVAKEMGTSQPALARLEAGQADPRLGTLRRFARAVDAEMLVVPDGAAVFVFWAHRIADALQQQRPVAERHSIAWRRALDAHKFAQDAARSNPTLRFHEPPPTGDHRFDALLAGFAELVTGEFGCPIPAWTAAPSRSLDAPWWPGHLTRTRAMPGLDIYALQTSPAALFCRGILLDPTTLNHV